MAAAGQAGRNGYIVIAPAWGREQQSEYGYTLAEHLAVLHTLRDACRHFSIDTDRVYLSGHSMGETPPGTSVLPTRICGPA